MIISARGVEDILPDRTYQYQWLERKACSIFSLHGYDEIRTPTFEKTELFLRSVGHQAYQYCFRLDSRRANTGGFGQASFAAGPIFGWRFEVADYSEVKVDYSPAVSLGGHYPSRGYTRAGPGSGIAEHSLGTQGASAAFRVGLRARSGL